MDRGSRLSPIINIPSPDSCWLEASLRKIKKKMSPVRLCIHRTHSLWINWFRKYFLRCSSTITRLLNFTVWIYLNNLVWKWSSSTELLKWNKVFLLGALKPPFYFLCFWCRKSQIRVSSPWPWLTEGGRQKVSSNRFLKCTRLFASNLMEIQTTRNFGNREIKVTGWNPHWQTK